MASPGPRLRPGHVLRHTPGGHPRLCADHLAHGGLRARLRSRVRLSVPEWRLEFRPGHGPVSRSPAARERPSGAAPPRTRSQGPGPGVGEMFRRRPAEAGGSGAGVQAELSRPRVAGAGTSVAARASEAGAGRPVPMLPWSSADGFDVTGDLVAERGGPLGAGGSADRIRHARRGRCAGGPKAGPRPGAGARRATASQPAGEVTDDARHYRASPGLCRADDPAVDGAAGRGRGTSGASARRGRGGGAGRRGPWASGAPPGGGAGHSPSATGRRKPRACGPSRRRRGSTRPEPAGAPALRRRARCARIAPEGRPPGSRGGSLRPGAALACRTALRRADPGRRGRRPVL